MNKVLFTAALSAAVIVGSYGVGLRAQSLANQEETGLQSAGVFEQWLAPNSPECVPISDIGAVSRLIKLTPEQFQFVRALYIAIPPVSRQLPPGDSAVVASANGRAMIALVSDGQSCARFLAPDFVLSMLLQVGRGENGTVGQPI
jgi:hypothetical protein